MKYKIKEVELSRGEHVHKRLLIEFEDKRYAILTELLMVDAPLLNWRILDELDAVLHDEKSTAQFTGNRTKVELTKETTTIDDLLSDLMDEAVQLKSLSLKTTELHDLVLNWYEKVQKFKQKN